MTGERGNIFVDDAPSVSVAAQRAQGFEQASDHPVRADASWLDIFNASRRTTVDTIEVQQISRLGDAYVDLERQLVRAGVPRDRLWATSATPGEVMGYSQGMAPGTVRSINRDAVWQTINQLRQQPGSPFANLPRDREAFDQSILTRDGRHQADLATQWSGQGLAGLSANLAGGALGSFADPLNVLTMAVPMGRGNLATTLVRFGGFNAALEAAQTPQFIRAKENLGEEVTPGLIAFNIGAAAVGGAIFGGADYGARYLAGRYLRGRPGDAATGDAPTGDIPPAEVSNRQLVRAVEEAVPVDQRSPEQVAAMNVLRRQAEIDEVNPYRADAAGLQAHADRLAEAMARVDPSAPAPPRRPAPSNRAASIDMGIVSALTQRGIPESVARGVAAGIEAESRSSHTIVNDSSGAFGLGQWLGPRKRELFRRYGSRPTREQQLEFLAWELRGGDHGGAAVLAARSEQEALNAYIRRFMRPAEGAETTGDLRRGMAALGREREGTPGDDASRSAFASGGGDDASGPIIRPEAMDAVRPLVTGPDRSAIPMQTYRAADLGVDAELMQFKSGGDAAGVTDRLQGVRQWDPMAAGMVTVWEPINGRPLIADGHQRHGLAMRMMAADPTQDISLPAFVLREADGFTARDARVLTALKNIGEGSGTAADAARVFREAGPELLATIEAQLPPRSSLVRDGRALSRLSPDAFGAIVNDVIPEPYGAAIGALAPDPATHIGLVDLLVKTDPPNRRQAESIIRQAMAAGFHRETQNGLFGAADSVTALFAQRARVLDRTLGELRKMKGAFSVAARNADALEGAGNRIDVAASTLEAAGNARALGIIDRLAYSKGPVSDILNAAAKRIADGEPLATVVRDTVRAIRALDLDTLARGADDGAARAGIDGSGAAAVRGGSDGNVDPQAGSAPRDYGADELTPAERDALEAAGQGGFDIFDTPAGSTAAKAFDDPVHGDGVTAVADSLWHDIDADAAALPAGSMFDLDDGRGARSLDDIRNEIDSDLAAVEAARRCL